MLSAGGGWGMLTCCCFCTRGAVCTCSVGIECMWSSSVSTLLRGALVLVACGCKKYSCLLLPCRLSIPAFCMVLDHRRDGGPLRLQDQKYLGIRLGCMITAAWCL
ncbi:hypothetical protein COO60DRAFT_994518 [Scenedesmus sp. NREL 46B-D3]|nr:hypothetical protein COO60DRAFT_994518 [Scenedesmus sp. NREL 46B-D3]